MRGPNLDMVCAICNKTYGAHYSARCPDDTGGDKGPGTNFKHATLNHVNILERKNTEGNKIA